MSLTASITAAVPHQTYIAMANSTTILAQGGGEGSSQINQFFTNARNFLFVSAGSLVAIAAIVVGITLLFGSGNNFREKLGKLAVIVLGCIVIGGGSAVGGAFMALGSELTS